MIHGMNGNNDQAFEWLNRAIDQREVALVSIMVDPSFAGLRDDPRWETLLARMNLPISHESKFGKLHREFSERTRGN
jgi:hypothetical protein